MEWHARQAKLMPGKKFRKKALLLRGTSKEAQARGCKQCNSGKELQGRNCREEVSSKAMQARRSRQEVTGDCAAALQVGQADLQSIASNVADQSCAIPIMVGEKTC